jgi:glycosyltransferase involved in cell wall biosynthesis
MNVLLVSDTYAPDCNGVARSLAALAQGLVEQGHWVEVITATPGEGKTICRHVQASVNLPGYEQVRIAWPALLRLFRIIQELEPSAVYVATETPLGLAALLWSRLLGIRVVSGFHTNFHHYIERYYLPGLGSLAGCLLRWIHNMSARTLVPSSDTARMLEALGVRNVGVLGRGVNTELFHPLRRSDMLRAEWGANAETPVAILVGRLAAEKNLALAVRAFTAMQKDCPRLVCVVVGDGPSAARLAEENPWIIQAGARNGEDLARHYASADVFVFPSTSETFGNVVLEALASGLVTVAYDYAAAAKHIVHNQNGLLAPLHNEDAFVETARKGLQQWQQQDLRKLARHIAEQVGWPVIVKQFERELMG